MRWKGRRQSQNLDDRRNMRASAGTGGAGILMLFRVVPFLLGNKVGRIILVLGVVVFFGARFMGIDLLQVASSPGTLQQPRELSAQDQEMGEFVAVVLADTEDIWTTLFTEMGRTYQEPTLVLFRDRVNSACGSAQSAMGPFYCPGDQQLYIDLAFFDDLERQLNAPGDFAQAYVIAHEVGHHVQTLLGISSNVQRARQTASELDANRLSVAQELQADCFAGIWAHYANTIGVVEAGDIEEALTAAAAIGDDRLQQQSQGTVRPETFTHGTSAQRVSWFRRGFDNGVVDQCDTFNN
ncbi:MAG: neutral zinc metallopeptidase [Pseudohongiella sp.]|nr:neutral zinc metallopeptidase [Pseudohongiella sp.]